MSNGPNDRNDGNAGLFRTARHLRRQLAEGCESIDASFGGQYEIGALEECVKVQEARKNRESGTEACPQKCVQPCTQTP